MRFSGGNLLFPPPIVSLRLFLCSVLLFFLCVCLAFLSLPLSSFFFLFLYISAYGYGVVCWLRVQLTQMEASVAGLRKQLDEAHATHEHKANQLLKHISDLRHVCRSSIALAVCCYT